MVLPLLPYPSDLIFQWAGYAPLTYEVPLDVYDGRVSMQALSRRVARACVHYLQVKTI
jgi:hypothetical protein